MYAIVEIAGQQFKVEEGKKIFVHRLGEKPGAEIKFEQVLLIEDEGKITIGEPAVIDAFVEGKILDHMRGDKVIVFKKKRKKGYRVKNGHRQNFTQVEIVSINGKTTPKKVTPKKEEVIVTDNQVIEEPFMEKKPVEKKAAAKKPAAKKEKSVAKKEEASEKKASVKKVSEKIPAAKKPAAKKPKEKGKSE